MEEFYEFRVAEEFAGHLFRDDEGKKLPSGFIREIRLSASDPRIPEVGRLQREISRSSSHAFFYGWGIRRQYTPAELKRASLFTFFVTSVFEPAGEECGTVYDESAGCPVCGTGAVQLPPLILNTARIPKGKDISRTIADEIVISRGLVELLQQHGVSGCSFGPVQSKGTNLVPYPHWLQLLPLSSTATIVDPTRVGNGPFDDDVLGAGRCACGNLAGLNLLSEVSIAADSQCHLDVLATKQYIGVRRGLLRPRPVILISPKVKQLLESIQAKGWRTEVAHIV